MEHSCNTNSVNVDTKSVNVDTKSVNVDTKLEKGTRNRENIRALEKNILEWLENSFRDFQLIRPMIISFLVNNSDLFQQGILAKHLLNDLEGNLVSIPPPYHHAYSGQKEEQYTDVGNKISKDGESQSAVKDTKIKLDESQSEESQKLVSV